MTKITKSKVVTWEEEIPKTLMAFQNWTFSSGGTTGEDFKVFARLFRNHIKKQLPEGATLGCYPNHYYLYGFIGKAEKYVYFSISDVRFWKNSWFDHILIRTAESPIDYTGGCNVYTTLADFKKNVARLLGDQA